MVFSVKTLALSAVIFITTSSAPAKNFPTERSEKVPDNDVSKALDLFLDLYYDKYVAPSVDFKQANDDASDDARRNAKTSNVYETMQGDQPADENSVDGHAAGDPGGKSSQDDVRDAMRERARDHWLQILKENVLRQLNRSNVMTAPAESRLPPVNISLLFPNTPNETVPEEDMIANTIMSFYPSCTVPENAVPEFRNDDKLLNLFFNYTNDNVRAKVATATLRLHRIPLENSNSSLKNINCNNNTSIEDEKLLRVSIFWYTRLIRNRRRVVMKKRLCDSKVIAETNHWVEFNVRPAIRFWAREANLGLAVQVEDQEGRTLRADRYFKGTTCLPHIDQSPPSSRTTPNPLNDYITYWDEIQHRPFLVMYFCNRP